MIKDNSFTIRYLFNEDFVRLNNLVIGKVDKEVGQSDKTFIFENAIKMMSFFGDNSNLIWMANPRYFYNFNEMSLCVGTGHIPFYTTVYDDGSERYNSFLGGNLVLWSNKLPDVGKPWSVFLIDMKRFMKDEECVSIYNGDKNE